MSTSNCMCGTSCRLVAQRLARLGRPEDVNCWFDEPIGFSWREPSTQLVLAACYLADRIEPTVFAIETVAEEPGLVTVWKQGVDAPTTFHVCEAPG